MDFLRPLGWQVGGKVLSLVSAPCEYFYGQLVKVHSRVFQPPTFNKVFQFAQFYKTVAPTHATGFQLETQANTPNSYQPCSHLSPQPSAECGLHRGLSCSPIAQVQTTLHAYSLMLIHSSNARLKSIITTILFMSQDST